MEVVVCRTMWGIVLEAYGDNCEINVLSSDIYHGMWEWAHVAEHVYRRCGTRKGTPGVALEGYRKVHVEVWQRCCTNGTLGSLLVGYLCVIGVVPARWGNPKIESTLKAEVEGWWMFHRDRHIRGCLQQV